MLDIRQLTSSRSHLRYTRAFRKLYNIFLLLRNERLVLPKWSYSSSDSYTCPCHDESSTTSRLFLDSLVRRLWDVKIFKPASRYIICLLIICYSILNILAQQLIEWLGISYIWVFLQVWIELNERMEIAALKERSYLVVTVWGRRRIGRKGFCFVPIPYVSSPNHIL